MSAAATATATSTSPGAAPNGDSNDYSELRKREIATAAAVLSVRGPCQQVGDIYLTCVATAGLGMCRSLRASFESCAKNTTEESTFVLGKIADKYCPAIQDKEEKLLCAANMVNQQLFAQQNQN